MGTHNFILRVALLVGAALSIMLSIVTGFWLDQHRPIGREGVLVFLGAVVLIVLGVEAVAGFVGDWAGRQLQRRRAAR